jgi:hypothetical protein
MSASFQGVFVLVPDNTTTEASTPTLDAYGKLLL